MKKTTQRRSFIASLLAASQAPLLLSSSRHALAAEANSKINVAFIGTGKQVFAALLPSFLGQKDSVQVVAVSDVDTTRRTHTKGVVEKFYADNNRQVTVDSYNDYREIIARKDIDAVVVATPDHWHAIITQAALRSGKDVYCEKPLTHTVHEAITIMNDTQSYGRVLQTGSMQRSMKEFRVACELVQNGVIGKISKIVCGFSHPAVWCDLPEEEMEPGLDWERWLGPAPMRPYNSILSPRGVYDHYPMWRLYREYGGGFITDWGAHHLDIAQWALGMDESGPIEIKASPDGANAKSGASLVYADGVIVQHDITQEGVRFFGSDGEIFVSRGKFSLKIKEEVKTQFLSREDKTSIDAVLLKAEKEFLQNAKVKLYQSPKDNHIIDFLTCVKSRQKPCTHEVIGARTSIICSLMSQTYYDNVSIKWDPAKNTFADQSSKPEWLTKEYRSDYKLLA